MKAVFILCQDYPSDSNKYAMAFVHPRVKGYIEAGLQAAVISFATSHDYIYDGVNIYTVKEGLNKIKKESQIVLISHAPNIKKHLLFICRIWRYVYRLIFFFHGHEILSTKNYYPKPYIFNKKSNDEYVKLQAYDYIKLPIMKLFLKCFLKSRKCDLVFVSQWMLQAGSVSLGIKFTKFPNIYVINNSINPYIKEGGYSYNNAKGDFITIRPLDQSKYAIDLVVEFARKHPLYSFHIYGKGDYFKYNDKPNNVSIYNDFLSPKDIPTILDSYKYALMPTRLDAQGVMMCEMAVYGIPTIVSDISVCHEMLDQYENVLFVSNDNFDISFDKLPHQLSKPRFDFSFENTICKEVNLLQKYCK